MSGGYRKIIPAGNEQEQVFLRGRAPDVMRVFGLEVSGQDKQGFFTDAPIARKEKAKLEAFGYMIVEM